MLIPLKFWIRIGDWPRAPSRRRMLENPIPTLSPADAKEILSAELICEQELDPEGQAAYRKAADLALKLDKLVFCGFPINGLPNLLFAVVNDEAVAKSKELLAKFGPSLSET